MGIRCFLLEPTERVRQKLRRYHSSAAPGEACPAMPGNWSYHNAEGPIEDTQAIFDTNPDLSGVIRNGVDEASVRVYDDDSRWPTHCACGYVFTDEDVRQVFSELIYRRADTGEEMTLREAPPGAMWYCPWMGHHWHPQLGTLFSVRLPDGTDWMPDMPANNCTMPDDQGQEQHHCWIVEGQLPNITVGKNGATCGAGAGSIQSTNYHGFLRNGELT